MPDITMCSGHGCEPKNRCYRHRAEPTPFRQSYFAKPPFKTVTLFVSTETTCSHFAPTELGDKQRRTGVNKKPTRSVEKKTP